MNSLKKTNYIDSKYGYPKDINFLFIDVETANSRNDSLCAIGAYLIKNGKEAYTNAYNVSKILSKIKNND